MSFSLSTAKRSSESTLARPATARSYKRAPPLTPREVERRYPMLSRQVLAKRRAFGLLPEHEIVSGCILYAEAEIERFVAARAEATRPGAPQRCAIYARADSLFDPSDAIVEQVEACEARLRETGWTFAGSCVDFGLPNTTKNLRGGFRSLLEQAALGDFDILLVHDTSHISANARGLRSFVRQLAEANVRVCGINPIDRVCRQKPNAIERKHDNVQTI